MKDDAETAVNFQPTYEFANCIRPISTCVSKNTLTMRRTFFVSQMRGIYLHADFGGHGNDLHLSYCTAQTVVCYGNRNLDGL